MPVERSQTYIARRRPVEMKARRVDEQQVIETWEGPRTAFPGDYVMTGTQDEHWPVSGAKFETLYDVLGPADSPADSPAEDGLNLRVRKKPLEVSVYQVYRPLTFQVGGEDFHADTGYFIVRYAEGNYAPCEPGVFFETFEVLRPALPEEDFSL